MKLKERLSALDDSHLSLVLLSAVAIVVFVLSVPLFFLGFPGIPLGWLLGSGIEILNYWTMIRGAKIILTPENAKPVRGAVFMIITTLMRVALWVGGLALAGFYTFRLESNWLNFWSTFAGYVPMTIVVVVSMIRKNKKKGEQK